MKNGITGTFVNDPDPEKIIKAFTDVCRAYMGWDLTVTKKTAPDGAGNDAIKNDKPVTA